MAKKILLADDSITIQKVIELTFSDEDFDVVAVGNGRLALERLSEVRPDIVLCDIIMPERDGYEVCEQIKSNPAWSHVPVLLLTGAFEPFDQERATRAGFDGSLAKPFEPETLIAKVKELLARPPRPAAAGPAAPVLASKLPPTTPPVFPLPPAIPPASVLPFARPAVLEPPAAAQSFIPDEPFSPLDDTSFAPEEGPSATAPRAVLASMSEAESASLAPPAPPLSDEDSASTVVFRGPAPRWEDAAPPAAAQKPAPGVIQEPTLVPLSREAPPIEAPADAEAETFEAVLEEDLDFGTPGYETEFVAETPLGARLETPAVDEPVLAPEMGAADFAVTAPVRGSGATGAFAALVPDEAPRDPAADTASFVESPISELPPGALPPGEGPEEFEALQDGGSPGTVELPAASPAIEGAAGDSSWGGEEISFPEPEPETVERLEEMAPVAPASAIVEAPPVDQPAAEALAALPAPVPAVAVPTPVAAEEVLPELPEEAAIETASLGAPLAEEEMPAARPASTESVTAATPPAISEEETFADELPQPARVRDVSEAAPLAAAAHSAELPVPVEMVERIAQRVIAQISDKVIREVAWEVIPDLAEAIIKKEIERLKAELAKL
jgi:CheY-like chemotaxis protein